MQAKDKEQLHEWKECKGAVMAIGDTHINDLSDTDLALIFKRLPPYTRLLVSEVCLRWWSVSQDAWLDITHLDLTFIPPPSMGAIIRMCPNLTSLFAKGQAFILDDLKDISPISFKALHLHDCIFASLNDSANTVALPLFRSAHGQSMEELVLHQHNYGHETRLSERYSQRLFPVSLKRLQLSGMRNLSFDAEYQQAYLTEMSRLRNLECLILHVSVKCEFPSSFTKLVSRALASLKNLRELYLPPSEYCHVGAFFMSMPYYLLPQHSDYLVAQALRLPKLEFLFLPSFLYRVDQARLDLLLNHPTLRVLVLSYLVDTTTHAQDVQPFRNRFPNGFAADPLPLLHVFFTEIDLFDDVDCPAMGLEVHEIEGPLSEYLEDEEVKSIFEGSWIAKQIEGAKLGDDFFDCGKRFFESTDP